MINILNSTLFYAFSYEIILLDVIVICNVLILTWWGARTVATHDKNSNMLSARFFIKICVALIVLFLMLRTSKFQLKYSNVEKTLLFGIDTFSSYLECVRCYLFVSSRSSQQVKTSARCPNFTFDSNSTSEYRSWQWSVR